MTYLMMLMTSVIILLAVCQHSDDIKYQGHDRIYKMANPLLSVRVSQELLDEIDRAAALIECDRSEFVVQAIAEKLGNKKFLPVSKQIEDLDRRLTLVEKKISVLVEN